MNEPVKPQERKVKILVGCNWPDPRGDGELRGEPGQTFILSKFKPASLKALTDMGAVKEV